MRTQRIIGGVTSAVPGLTGSGRKLARLNVGRRRVDVEDDPVDIRRDRRVRVISDKGKRFRTGRCPGPVKWRAPSRSVTRVTRRNNALGDHRAGYRDFDRRVPGECDRSAYQAAPGLRGEQQAPGRNSRHAPGEPGSASTPVHALLHPFPPAALRAQLTPGPHPSAITRVPAGEAILCGDRGGTGLVARSRAAEHDLVPGRDRRAPAPAACGPPARPGRGWGRRRPARETLPPLPQAAAAGRARRAAQGPARVRPAAPPRPSWAVPRPSAGPHGRQRPTRC